MEKTLVTDLFRFATLRAPQLITKERRKLGFVENSGYHHTHFFGGSDMSRSLDLLRLEIQGKIDGFEPIKTVDKVKGYNFEFYDFSLWLSENKDALKRDDLGTIINGVSLDDEIVSLMWDNVYYDILTEKNPYVRQACIQMLVADNFIRNYENYSPNTDEELAEEEARLLKRLANGKLVIHPAVTREKVVAVPSSRRHHLPSQRQEQKLKAQIASLKASEKKKIETELSLFKTQYDLDHKAAYDIAQSEYQEIVKPIISQFLESNPEIENSENPESLIPEKLIEPFSFTFNSPLSSRYAEGKLSNEAQKFVDSKKLHEVNLDSAINIIASEKKSQKLAAANTIQKRVSELAINGVQIKAANDDAKEFAISFEETDIENEYLLYFSMDAGYRGAFFKEGSFTLQVGEEQVTTNFANPCLKEVADTSIFVQITNEPITLDPCTSYIFSAVLTMNNDAIYTVERSGTSNQRLASGRAYRSIINVDEKVIYGVNRIGVVDYRKVEQELCCYIPGEVSHIENIMAKEYKDRTTRSLSRVEQSTELSSEQEVETSTDTTTTERNEMNSEIAKMIEKDRSTDLGFNASAGGGKEGAYQWAASGSADFSFGQSTSNSNTIARTKAQELTQRALERVVQRVSSTRTSKMLREFEDTSTHGFDNRKGNSHITGVYRWVDKVYKNRIINYGKRLIYEFMIPEPSRWYKEAIIIEKEESDTTGNNGNSASVLVKPIHPKDNEIVNSDSITRENFSKLAGLYGTQITAPMDKNKTISESYAESVNDNKEHSYNSYSPVQFPDGYVCVRIIGSMSGYYKSTSSPYAYLKIGTGTNSFVKNFGDGKGNYTDGFDYGGLNASPSSKITISMKKVDTVNLSVQFVCELSQENYKQWQQDAYSNIMEAYNQQLSEYNDALAQAQADLAAKEAAAKEEEGAEPSNSRFNAQIINTEIKRLCIEMLTSAYGRQQGKDLYTNGECKVPKIALSDTLDEYGSQVKFFEQAFDWSILSQMFYPYYWAKKCDWKALFQSQDSGDMNFQSFLQSGMARVMVPVRQGFEDAVVFYMETGKIWNGNGMVVDTDDELYLSIVDEMTEIKGFTEGEEWETIVPSDLTIIQAKSAFLEDEGLPCCEDRGDVPVNLKFQGTDQTLTLKDEEPEEDPI